MDIIDLVGSVNRLEGHVGGVGKSEEIRHEFAPTKGVNNHGEKRNDGDEEVHFRLTSFLFEVTEAICIRLVHWCVDVGEGRRTGARVRIIF